MSKSGEIPDPGRRKRYSTQPFPAYRYVPGFNPHPRRDVGGHSYRSTTSSSSRHEWRPEDWRGLESWLFGIDLFNAHYFWEAHEAWEELWVTVDRDSTAGLFLQGLIQIAAALLKTHLGSVSGARALSQQGIEKLRRVASITPTMMGLDVIATLASIDNYFAPLHRGELPALDGARELSLAI